MKTQVTPCDAQLYREQGYFILRGAVPAPLIDRLRVMAEEARTVAHRLEGPQTQRLMRIGEHVDTTAAREFQALSEINEAFHTILSPGHTLAPGDSMTILFQPENRCWATAWHRDLRDHVPDEMYEAVLGGGKWEEYASDYNLFNQINCALYEDTSTWYVPGTHARLDATAEQLAVKDSRTRAELENWAKQRSEAEQEVFLQEYCESMPGAVQIILQAGDLVLYRNCAWHIGNYVPYRRRATLHTHASTREFEAYKVKMADTMKRIKAHLDAEGAKGKAVA
jgi:ectoine hydroxylase-related dioxygenase (phytanoyl-CoA dioxygenase family)